MKNQTPSDQVCGYLLSIDAESCDARSAAAAVSGRILRYHHRLAGVESKRAGIAW